MESTKTIRDNGKRIRVSTMEHKLAKERGGVWVHEEKMCLRRVGEWYEKRFEFPPQFGSYFSDSGDFFYRISK